MQITGASAPAEYHAGPFSLAVPKGRMARLAPVLVMCPARVLPDSHWEAFRLIQLTPPVIRLR